MRASQELDWNIYISHGRKRSLGIKLCPCVEPSALHSGITVTREVHQRRGYCWLKTFPNTPQDDLKYNRLCNFWGPRQGPHKNSEKNVKANSMTTSFPGSVIFSPSRSERKRRDRLVTWFSPLSLREGGKMAYSGNEVGSYDNLC